MVLLVRTIDDNSTTHASASTTQGTTLCGTPQGHARLDPIETMNYDPTAGTSFIERLPATVTSPADVTCARCAEMLAPKKIRPQTAAAAPAARRSRKIPPAKPLDKPAKA